MVDVFKETLMRGQIAERILASRFLEVGADVQWTNEKNSGCDLTVRLPGKSLFRIEIKDEQNYAYTGNIAIERIQNKNKDPSGLAITTSDVWIHSFGTDGPYFAFRVVPMKRFLHRNREQYPIKPFGQADNKNAGQIVPIAVLQTQNWADYCESFEDLFMSSIWDWS
jgi:hypothetical protein